MRSTAYSFRYIIWFTLLLLLSWFAFVGIWSHNHSRLSSTKQRYNSRDLTHIPSWIEAYTILLVERSFSHGKLTLSHGILRGNLTKIRSLDHINRAISITTCFYSQHFWCMVSPRLCENQAPSSSVKRYSFENMPHLALNAQRWGAISELCWIIQQFWNLIDSNKCLR